MQLVVLQSLVAKYVRCSAYLLIYFEYHKRRGDEPKGKHSRWERPNGDRVHGELRYHPPDHRQRRRAPRIHRPDQSCSAITATSSSTAVVDDLQVLKFRLCIIGSGPAARHRKSDVLHTWYSPSQSPNHDAQCRLKTTKNRSSTCSSSSARSPSSRSRPGPPRATTSAASGSSLTRSGLAASALSAATTAARSTS
ncbi:hypothetical protein RHGRI_033795 [Rhododendron griersonianum]|uniref:Uncharacterized protein n=1 Tax=Rhododendron griersonianum TaxID=479676 RepID=A0AAV6I2I5_9ERIC|nr:hypothetical protein RHGRI_033795 [Rhododendron griersonianum]